MSRKIYSLVGTLFLLLLILLVNTPRTSAQSASLYINEILVGNASTNLSPKYLNYESWIEIYNAGSSVVRLTGFSLSYTDNNDIEMTWTISAMENIPARGYVLLWADEVNEGLHASFDLDMRGKEIRLLDPSGNVLDSVIYDMRDKDKVLLPDISYGRQSDGSWAYFDRPTPAAANTTTGFVEPDLAAAPMFDPPGGFYDQDQTVRLSTTEPGGTIRYTIDGSIPTASSSLYNGPLSVTRLTVIRARVFAPGKQMSRTASHTYLLRVNRNLPVISLATAPAHLFDNRIGMYQKWSRRWERPASVEMFETDGRRVVAQDVGFEIYGQASRRWPQKSLEIKAKRIYGDNDIDYQVLPDKTINEYKRLILRNSGHDAHHTFFRDALQQYLVKDMMDIDYQAYRPVVVYLNGAYWGIYNLRDKADEAYVEQNYGLDADTDFDMIHGSLEVIAGNRDAWDDLYAYIQNNDLRDPDHYRYVESQIDIEEYMNYMITQLYGGNSDWPGNNNHFWRAYEGGRWRWVLYDLDMGFGIPYVQKDHFSDLVDCRKCKPKHEYHGLMFKKLLQNVDFRSDFVQRYASHINITYAPTRVNQIIDDIRAGIATEMPAHIRRWKKPASMTTWDARITRLRDFANARPAHVINHLNSYLGNPGTANLTVKVIGEGDVLAAGVKIPTGSYTGGYFRGIPMTLEAVPRSGWKFVRWQETGETEPELTLRLNANTARTAVFEEVPPPPIIINEIHYNAGAEDSEREFLELHNVDSVDVDLSGFTIEGLLFTFPDGARIAAGGYVILAANAENAVYDALPEGSVLDYNYDEDKLSNGGERIALLNADGNVVDEVTYGDNKSPDWPPEPDGDGPSLSLKDPAEDNAIATSWAPSRENGGTPGAVNFSPPPLVINEIHYNPSTDSAGDVLYEFLEIVNTGSVTESLDSMVIDGIDYTFPVTATIAAGEYIVVAKTAATYQGNGYQVFDWDDSNSLSNSGERIALTDKYGQVVDEVTYDEAAPWPTTPNGTGPSLSLLDPASDNSLATSWAASTQNGGSPGAVNFPQ